MAKDKEERLKASEVNIPEVYGNVANISYSPYEMEMTLGLISSNYEGIKPVVNVRMSPQFAKELAEILLINVEKYEQQIMKLDMKKQ